MERAADPAADEMLTEAGVLVVRRVAGSALSSVAEHCGARLAKRAVLRRSPEEMAAAPGFAREVICDDRRRILCMAAGSGRHAATILVGASTREVRGERERVARDAASAVQAVAGGGAGGAGVPGARDRLRYR